MKNLGMWQVASFGSRMGAQMLGVIQAFVILRIVSVTEWGYIQIVMSVGAIMGSYQHLGLASASTREVSLAKNEKEIFSVVLVSVFIRYLVTIPLALGLFFFAETIASKYNNLGLALPIKLYALVLFIQGFQSIFNAVISGTKKFKKLFIYQVLIAVVNVLLYIPLVHTYKVNGYFYALVAFNIIATLSLGVIAMKPLGLKNMRRPSSSDFIQRLKEMFGISMAIYIVKIIYNYWENIGVLLAGLFASPLVVGQYTYAKLYSKKLMTISDSVTDVNLAVFSDSYAKDLPSFAKTFLENFNKVFALTILVAASAVFWSKEVMILALGKNDFAPAIPFILPVMFAFVFYSFVNIIKSSVFIPAKYTKGMIVAFSSMLLVTVITFFAINTFSGVIEAASISFSLGAFVALVYMIIYIKSKMHFWLFSHDHILLLLQAFVFSWGYKLTELWFKIPIFFALTLMLLASFQISKFMTKKELLSMVTRKGR